MISLHLRKISLSTYGRYENLHFDGFKKLPSSECDTHTHKRDAEILKTVSTNHSFDDRKIQIQAPEKRWFERGVKETVL